LVKPKENPYNVGPSVGGSNWDEGALGEGDRVIKEPTKVNQQVLKS